MIDLRRRLVGGMDWVLHRGHRRLLVSLKYPALAQNLLPCLCRLDQSGSDAVLLGIYLAACTHHSGPVYASACSPSHSDDPSCPTFRCFLISWMELSGQGRDILGHSCMDGSVIGGVSLLCSLLYTET